MANASSLTLAPAPPQAQLDQLPSAGTLPSLVSGVEMCELADGRWTRIVQLNNAATTPPLSYTLAKLNEFMGHYGALHRGAGPRARLTCDAIEEAIASIRAFVGAGPDHAVVFTENTSAAINLLARLLGLGAEDVVLTSEIEHTSNYLPWRLHAGRLIEVDAKLDGGLDYDDLEGKVAQHRGRVKVIAVTGASNQTGYIPDLKRLSEIAAGCGALLFVDAAQLAPHRPIRMDEDGIGALAFSAHKVYAPFGLGALVVPSALLETSPVNPGGGSIDMISVDRVVWAPARERHQTGTWNAAGIVALGASCRALLSAGWDCVIAHERELSRYAVTRLSTVPGLNLHVPASAYLQQNRIGAFPFSIEGRHHALIAAVLEREHGIEVRSGTICNHRLVRRWFNISDVEQARIEAQIEAGDRLASYGIVRASIGIQNTAEDIDTLADALTSISQHGPRGAYRPVPSEETFELA